MNFPDWGSRISRDLANDIIAGVKQLGDGCYEKDCFWRGYQLQDKFYLGLCDGPDLWEVDEETCRNHCMG